MGKYNICRFVLVIAGALLLPLGAFAACYNPSSPEATIIYNADHETMQYCAGTTWVTMDGIGIYCAEGDGIVMTSAGWNCSPGGPP